MGQVEGNEELDKEMWGDEDNEDKEEKEEDEELEESKEQGTAEEEVGEDLKSNDKQESKRDGEKRQRKDEEQAEPEFEDEQVDEVHGQDQMVPEPEAFDLPNQAELDADERPDEEFEEPAEDNEPQALPDFEDKEEEEGMDEDSAEDGEDGQDTKVEPLGDTNDDDKEDENGEKNNEDDEENMTEEQKVKTEEKDESRNEESFATDEEQKGVDAVQNENDLDKNKKDKTKEAGMNDTAQNQAENDAFSVLPKEPKEDEAETGKKGRGTDNQQERTLADEQRKSERLELVEGEVRSEEGQRRADIFQHVMDKRDEDRAALDRADKDVKEQVFHNDFEMEVDDEKETVPRLEEINQDKKKTDSLADQGGKEEEDKGMDKEKRDLEKTGEKEFVPTVDVARGTETLIIRQARCSHCRFYIVPDR
jgi:midasin